MNSTTETKLWSCAYGPHADATRASFHQTRLGWACQATKKLLEALQRSCRLQQQANGHVWNLQRAPPRRALFGRAELMRPAATASEDDRAGACGVTCTRHTSRPSPAAAADRWAAPAGRAPIPAVRRPVDGGAALQLRRPGTTATKNHLFLKKNSNEKSDWIGV